MATIEHKEINKQKINRYILDNTAGQETPILGTVTSFYKLLVGITFYYLSSVFQIFSIHMLISQS